MNSRRGYTLIELMVFIAVLGISAAAVGVAGTRLRQSSRAAIQQEQAQVLLDYHAELVATGQPPRQALVDRLEAPLPQAALRREDLGATSTLTLRWVDPMGRSMHRALTVFRSGGSP